MAQICGKHDVAFADGGECWCCEEQKLNATPGAREAAYRNPQFLKKRGGLDANTAQRSVVLDKLSTLKPEEIDRLLALAGASPAGGGAKRVIG
jgi:hypothetical protein